MTRAATPDQRKDRIIAAVRAGASKATAAKFAGISPRTLRRWAKEQPEFRESLLQADGACETNLLAKIHAATDKNWMAAAWILERRFPERWARPILMSEPIIKTIDRPPPLETRFKVAADE